MKKKYDAVVIGASAGGFEALKKIVPQLSASFLPVIVVIHIKDDAQNLLAPFLDNLSKMKVKEAESSEKIKPGTVYFAPPGYHLLIEPDYTFALSIEERVNYSRPSIDVLFESAAFVYQESLIGILLTGANSDGSQGLAVIKKNGGLTIVQDPRTAEASAMPESAIKQTKIDHILQLDEIAPFLNVGAI